MELLPVYYYCGAYSGVVVLGVWLLVGGGGRGFGLPIPAMSRLALIMIVIIIMMTGLLFAPLSSSVLLIQPAEAATATTTEAPKCLGGTPITVGTNNDDVIQGTEGNDVIAGLGGNDRIFGKGGNDKLYGDAGDDFLHGGVGNDLGDGGPNFDTCVNVETVRNCET